RTRVGEVHTNRSFLRGLKAQFREPTWYTRAAPTGIDDEVGSEGLRVAVLGVADSMDTTVFAHQPLHDAVTMKLHIRTLQRTLAYAVFEQTATLGMSIKPEVTGLAHTPAESVCFPVGEVTGQIFACSYTYATQMF